MASKSNFTESTTRLAFSSETRGLVLCQEVNNYAVQVEESRFLSLLLSLWIVGRLLRRLRLNEVQNFSSLIDFKFKSFEIEYHNDKILAENCRAQSFNLTN